MTLTHTHTHAHDGVEHEHTHPPGLPRSPARTTITSTSPTSTAWAPRAPPWAQALARPRRSLDRPLTGEREGGLREPRGAAGRRAGADGHLCPSGLGRPAGRPDPQLRRCLDCHPARGALPPPERARRTASGMFVVATIFASACVAVWRPSSA
jgi:hypothetical protein